MEKKQLKRDFIFEFAGMPKSGKTTVLRIIEHFLKGKGYRIQEFHGGGHYAPIDKNEIGSFNLYLAAKAIESLVVFSQIEKRHPRILLMDRGIFDRCIWTKVLVERKEIKPSETEAILNFLTVPRLLERIDGVFLFVSSPQLCLEREAENKLIVRTGRVMNQDRLTALRSVSLNLAKHYSNRLSHIHVLDTDKLDGKIKSTAEVVAEKILSIIQKSNGR